MIKKLFTLILFCFTLTSAFAAERVIKGIIISNEDKEPLIGAAVAFPLADAKKDAKVPIGVITDVEGKFTITVPENAADYFICSYIGHTSQNVKLVAGKDYYEIVLSSSDKMLGSVIVTGYQTIERRKLTAAVSTLSISDETVGAVSSLDQALTGQIAGLSAVSMSGSPTAPMKIRIRGTASLNGTQDPLWVLDGIPLEGTDIPKLDVDNDITNIRQSSIAGLNPADIETITVLKDVAATAIYGARAANGVIVITTKKGQKGNARVTFSSKFTYSPTLNTDRLNLLNAEEKVNLELDMLNISSPYYTSKGGVTRILNNRNQMNDYKQGGWDALSAETQGELNALKRINTDWSDILFRDAFNQEYNVSISGGTDKVTYYNSLGFFSQAGNVKQVNSDRFNLVSKTFYQVNSKLKVGLSVFANRRSNRTYMTDKYGLVNPLYYSRIANPYNTPYDELGNYQYDSDVQTNENEDLKFNVFEGSSRI